MDIPTLRSDAYNATQQTADMQASAPGLLSQLKQNLVGIFSKDNPIIGARNTALSDYLSENANTRASMLPANTGDVPGIAGRPLTYSPTQQDAITTSRNAAALAPLAGYNEILKGMFGNIGDLVQNAGGIYQSTIQGNATRAAGLMDLYKQAVQEDQFNRQLAASRANAGGYDIESIIKSLRGELGLDAKRVPLNHPSLQDPDKKKAAAQPKPTQPASQALTTNDASWFDSLMSLLGATPKPGQNQQTSFAQSLPSGGLNFGKSIPLGGMNLPGLGR